MSEKIHIDWYLLWPMSFFQTETVLDQSDEQVILFKDHLFIDEFFLNVLNLSVNYPNREHLHHGISSLSRLQFSFIRFLIKKINFYIKLNFISIVSLPLNVACCSVYLLTRSRRNLISIHSFSSYLT